MKQVPWLEPWENPVIETIKGFDVIHGKTLDSMGLPFNENQFVEGEYRIPMLGSYLAAGGL